jgi:hypothetical protein
MILFMLDSVSTSRLSTTLPKNLCSSAAQASLVAGSRTFTRLGLEGVRMRYVYPGAVFTNERLMIGRSTGDDDGKDRFGIDVAALFPTMKR